MTHDIWILLRGLALGLVLAAPVGPIGLLCIRRSVEQGMLIGFATGLGAATIDASFAAIAAFGVTAALSFFTTHITQLQMIGVVVLFVIAWVTWHEPIEREQEDIAKTQKARDFVTAISSGFFLTLTNPVTIFAILAVVATFGGALRPIDAAILTGGVFSGSTLWWVVLSTTSTLLSKKFSDAMLLRINRGTAVALAIAAVLILAHLGFDWLK